LFHSRLSDGQRLHEWFKVKNGYAPLIIGSRSAIFAPVKDLGVLIVDEEHEWTYKQESSPYYETHRVAEMMQERTGCSLIFGTATPRLETLYKARQGEYAHVRLFDRINSFALPKINVVDLREEFRRKNYSIFSQALFSGIQDRLQKKEQIILFVNQRGMARAVICRDCGQAIRCPECEVSLKLHGGSYGTRQYLLCHYCSYRTEPKLNCPNCGSTSIRHAGLGTERVEEELSRTFPQARVVRDDKDTTSDKSGFEPIYEAFKEGRYDILVGTQMVAKGLDFPDVTLIGIMLADIGLHVPDFRSHERLFQLITQVSGRAGRGKSEGEVVLQTYQPEHHAIRMAADYAYDEFADRELKFRERLKYPPFSHLVKFIVSGTDQAKLEKHVRQESEILEDIFKVNQLPVTITAAPAMISKIGKNYYYHVLLRSADPHLIFKHWKVPKGWRVDIDPVHTT
ncbi:MAG: primosomal protein N', partial [Patescibacteria group bacterium]